VVGDYGQARTARVDGVAIHRGMLAGAGAVRNGCRLFRAIADVDADVYMQRSLAVATTLIALFCRLRGKHFVYWVAHDGETDGSHPLSRSRLTGWWVGLMYRTASRIVVQNEYERERLSTRFPRARCILIKKGIVVRERSRDAKRIDAIWVGRCDDWKNPQAFIRLARNNPARRFEMVCPPAVDKEDRYVETRREAQSCPNLEFHGRIAHRAVLQLMNESRLFCITSSQEGDWPNVVLEAASLGLPVLSLSLNYPGLIDEFGGGVYCHDDEREMGRQFERLLRDDDELASLGRGARNYVRSVHDVARQTSKLLEALDGLD
ncbi:MAG: glycosyltransferase, partial [Proteobacteria bacterium]|nr:glycosyltransferase [Pseudomonadota bacterium]